MIPDAPASRAFATARTMPRSLNEPVGFWPSTLRYRFTRPKASPRCAARTSGVNPSPRVSWGVDAETGRNAAYRSRSRGRADGAGCTGAAFAGAACAGPWVVATSVLDRIDVDVEGPRDKRAQ